MMQCHHHPPHYHHIYHIGFWSDSARERLVCSQTPSKWWTDRGKVWPYSSSSSSCSLSSLISSSSWSLLSSSYRVDFCGRPVLSLTRSGSHGTCRSSMLLLLSCNGRRYDLIYLSIYYCHHHCWCMMNDDDRDDNDDCWWFLILMMMMILHRTLQWSKCVCQASTGTSSIYTETVSYHHINHHHHHLST